VKRPRSIIRHGCLVRNGAILVGSYRGGNKAEAFAMIKE